MALRLPHVLVCMTLILAAGVVSVQQLAADAGATVPGLVLVQASQLDAAGLASVAARLAGAHDEQVAVGPEPFAPFELDRIARRGTEGAATALVSVPHVEDAPLRRGWRVIVMAPERPLADVATDFLRGQSGVRAFVLGLDPGPEIAAADLAALLAPLLDVSETLPGTRRTSLVILGGRDPLGRRLVLRIDRGPWGERARPQLADLLEDAW
jgi:hypothetical protein